ncbi:MAG TPA: glycerol-3-phosphate dehydrogenase/oxidase [bacterium]|nr:glycerol-3-phosphate dehydrogenase/oxidase [bacterium]
MKRFIEDLNTTEFDVVVIGGGITGAAVAYDAASRGLSVALVEKNDFGCATSAATSKLIHGGFRYLANLEFGIVRESLKERRTLENIAPNLVYPMRVIVPCYKQGITKHTWAVRLGMMLYDSLSFDKGRTWDKSKSIGFHKAVPAMKALEMEPSIPRKGFKKAFSYYDCASIFPERLTLAFVKSAVKSGARVSNYSKVEGFVYSADGSGKRIAGVNVKDLISGRSVELRSKLTINCGGPWADLILDAARGESGSRRIRRSEGIHIITKKPALNGMLAMVTSSGGGFVMTPWRGRTLIGPTDKDYEGNPDDYRVTREAIMELIGMVNDAMRGEERIGYEDVEHAYGGLRPLLEDKKKSVRESSRRYEIYDNEKDGLSGLITVEGGKYTTSRNLAHNVMKMVSRKLNLREPKCVTDKQHLAGCEIEDMNAFLDEKKTANNDFNNETIWRLGKYYGREIDGVLEIARQDKALAAPLNADGEIAAQAVYAIREEMALTLKDILFRRTGLGTIGDPGDAVVDAVADVAAEELGWDDSRKSKEVAEAKKMFEIPR